ncbi:RHS repeat-associated core domain-containing protein [Neolewinella agarilytica]|uniref:RHS repeat-associated core domain-containing protein n=1 Tax=Neolewinella agarilytica TaxID=478744 RepID=UPI001587DED5|nr:RHS repeat-associated core domain-containing protein [Neolewinella agarilytica]
MPATNNDFADRDPVTGDPVSEPSIVTSPVTFYLHDHLGNTRVTFRADSPSDIAIEYAADYYPYGKILREYRPCHPNRYLSTHHERDAETGYDNRGARLYDSELGRFLGVDPLASKFPGWSPFNYVVGNPNSLIDPDGRMPSGPGDPPSKTRLNFELKLGFGGTFGGEVEVFGMKVGFLADFGTKQTVLSMDGLTTERTSGAEVDIGVLGVGYESVEDHSKMDWDGNSGAPAQDYDGENKSTSKFT